VEENDESKGKGRTANQLKKRKQNLKAQGDLQSPHVVRSRRKGEITGGEGKEKFLKKNEKKSSFFARGLIGVGGFRLKWGDWGAVAGGQEKVAGKKK